MLITSWINRNMELKKQQVASILCTREDEIGDVCYSMHVFRLLKMQFPGSRITFLCKQQAADLVRHCPDVDEIVTKWDDVKSNFDLIVDLRPSLKSNLFALRNRPNVRVDRGTVRFRNKLKGHHPHEVITNYKVVEPLLEFDGSSLKPSVYQGENDLEKAKKFIAANTLASFAVIHAGARRELRKWPLDRYAETATLLKKEYGLDIVFCGGIEDISDIAKLRELISFPVYSIAGDFSLSEYAAFVSQAKLFIGNESGPLHIASVSGVPSLGIFGPGEPFVFYPEGRKTAWLHEVLECNPCDQIHCIHPENPCIRRISIAAVMEKVKILLAGF